MHCGDQAVGSNREGSTAPDCAGQVDGHRRRVGVVSSVNRDGHAVEQQARAVIAHEYGEIKQERLWVVATVHVEDLIPKLRLLVPPVPPAGDT